MMKLQYKYRVCEFVSKCNFDSVCKWRDYEKTMMKKMGRNYYEKSKMDS